MRTRLLLAALTAALAGSVVAVAIAAGDNTIGYSFRGTLSSTPAGGQIELSVTGGDHPALKAMLGRPTDQTFSYDSTTEFLKWSNGIPSVVQAGDLQSGDDVSIDLQAAPGSDLSTLESTAAGVVGDHGTDVTPPSGVEYLFRGKVTAKGVSSLKLAIKSGNERGANLLIGKSATQMFAVSSSTVFLSWTGKVPTVISLADVNKGDDVAVHVRAAAGSTLRQVEFTPAARVAEHEPATATTS